MFANNIKLAFRNLRRDHLYAAINIGGLAVGIAASIMLMLWVQDELSFDQFHQKAERIYRVNANFDNAGTKVSWDVTPGPIASSGKREIPAIQQTVRISRNSGTELFSYRDKDFTENRTAYVEESFFNIFDFPLLKGNAANPFPNNNTIVISESTARKYFGDEEALGKTILMNNKIEFTVSGIIRDMPSNSTLQYTILFPFNILITTYEPNAYWKSLDSDWGNYNYYTFLLLDDRTSTTTVARQLSDLHHRNHKEGVGVTYILQPLTKLHLYGADMSAEGMQTVRIFLIVAVAILLIACINYINLATARAAKRAREVGIRKTVGADRGKLIAQFLTESAIISILALLFSLIIIQLVIPFYNELSGKNLSFDLSNQTVLAFLLLALTSTWFIAGIYPALVLSAFLPIQVIRGKLSLSGGNSTFRKILVVTQFTLSIAIIVGTLVVGKQLEFIRNRKLGFNKENIFTFGLRDDMFKNKETVKAELIKQPGIEAVTLANQNILHVGNTTGDTDWDGKPANQDFMIHAINIDEDFLRTLAMEIVEGKGFTGAKTDTAALILNETAIKEAGIKDPIGKRFALWGNEGTIIGVVKDFHHRSMHKKIEPSVFFYNPKWMWLVYIKTNEKNNAAAIAAAQKIWQRYNPDYPFDYNFMDVAYDNMYKSEQRMEKLFTAFSAIAILISCLGLFGLATFTATQRTKEIGIRKVLGASVNQIVTLLSKDFLKLVVFALIIAIPISYYAMHNWLQDFAYRITIDWSVFAIAGVLALLIAFLTMSFQTIKAAFSNPVNSLRNE